jgi:hypothetical protein
MGEYWNLMADLGWCDPIERGAVPPGEVDESNRRRLRAEIDALVAREAFRLTREELEWVIDSFDVLKRAELRKFGEFRTKHMVLGCFDAIA